MFITYKQAKIQISKIGIFFIVNDLSVSQSNHLQFPVCQYWNYALHPLSIKSKSNLNGHEKAGAGASHTNTLYLF